jgi:ATP/maltotriose-dependent transcriptional regulator MalT
MIEAEIPGFGNEDAGRTPTSPGPCRQLDVSASVHGSLYRLDNGMQPRLTVDRAATAPWPDPLRRCGTRQNLTGATLPRIRRGLVLAWRLVLALRTDDAVAAIDRIERELDDMPPEAAAPLREAARLVRAAGLVLRDDTLAALAIAVAHLKQHEATADCHVAATICRLGFWQLRQFDALYSLPRQRPRLRWSRKRAISAVLDLSVEATAALDHLHLSAAKRLAFDALILADEVRAAGGLVAFPASLVAQVLYEEGDFDEADAMLRDRLPAVNADGSIECALRVYIVLARIAGQREQYDLAAILLREGEALGDRRGWRRLVAACLAERTALLLAAGRPTDAGLCVEYLDRCAEASDTGAEHARVEILRFRTLARCRVAWAEAPSRAAVTMVRRLYHQALERHDLYAGCRLALELAEMLAAIGEPEEADALLFRTLKTGAATGLYQIFLEGGPGLPPLLRRAYDRVEEPGSTDREVLPLLGSLLSRWDARRANGRSAPLGGSVSDTLTARERDILTKISQGFPNKQIARALEISPETVKSHIKRIFLKLAVGTRAEAVSQAKSLGLL